MQIPVHRPSTWVLALAFTLATACDNRVTDPVKTIDPDEEIQAGKALSNNVIALEPLPGSPGYSAAYAINDLGQVVGESSSPAGGTAVIWDNSTVPQNLGMLAGHSASGATGISNDGRIIAGNSRDGSFVSHAVRWLNASGQWVIEPLSSGSGCFVNGISSDGTAIAGHCGAFAVVWVNGNRITLGQGSANGVNSKGQAVGYNSSFDHALMWTFLPGPVVETDLGTLGGTFAVANKINDAGQVTGWSANAENVSHAYLWSPRKGTMVDLTPGPLTSGGYGINATGKVVGDIFPSTQHPGYYDGRKVVDLGPLAGYDSGIALALNNNGRAVGVSSGGGLSRATMWILK